MGTEKMTMSEYQGITEKLDTIGRDVADVKTDIALIKQRLDSGDRILNNLPCQGHVARLESAELKVAGIEATLKPIRLGFYGAVGLCLSGLIGAVIALVIKQNPHP